ncbi:MAG: ATP phosphoribosyltransferase regulatory subunit [Lachnospiraceae bacterium]|nr:ATP phosphoribosyltransferase regulatory subunit [Lachnospiraceae bacterium]
MIQLLHTPEGVRDYYNQECARKQAICDRVRSLFALYGYQEIQTPVFEYFDIFNAERGSVASRDMYKLFDRDGETLVLRPDFTPAIARCAAKYFPDETMPVRLSYLGNTYVNNRSLRGQLKESMQAGVELVGESSVEANAEVLALVIDVLRQLGLSRFQIEVGDVRYFDGILQGSGISDDVRNELRACIENKNRFGLEELLEKHQISGEVAEVLTQLPQMFGDPEETLKQARRLAGENEMSLKAVDRLEALYHCMDVWGMSAYITFDLGMLGNHNYYTGIIFKGYTYGTGDCIVVGGRYDNLMGQFGKDAPSVGFGINIDTLMQAMMRQKIDLPGRPAGVLLLYAENRYQEAVVAAAGYRAQSIPVHLVKKEGQDEAHLFEYARENQITCILYISPGGSHTEKAVPGLHDAAALRQRAMGGEQ